MACLLPRCPCLQHCRNVQVGDAMTRGISGGEGRRLSTAEMLVGPARVLLLDEISTGLDSATLHSTITYLASVSALQSAAHP